MQEVRISPHWYLIAASKLTERANNVLRCKLAVLILSPIFHLQVNQSDIYESFDRNHSLGRIACNVALTTSANSMTPTQNKTTSHALMIAKPTSSHSSSIETDTHPHIHNQLHLSIPYIHASNSLIVSSLYPSTSSSKIAIPHRLNVSRCRAHISVHQ